MNEVPSKREEGQEETPDTVTQEQSQAQNYESSVTSSENSFLPGQAAFSSTPTTARAMRTQDSFASGTSDDPSWTASMESPLVRLDRGLREFSNAEDESLLPTNSKQISSLRFDEPMPHTKQDERNIHTIRSSKGKEKEADPLLRNVLRHNLHSMSDASSTTVSPVKFQGKPKTPIPKKFNPYLPPNKDPADWNGVVDLRDPSVRTPRHRHRTRTPSSYRNPTAPEGKSDDEDSFDGLPPGMSPPVMMSPARPPRSSAELGLLGQTPTREASARITRDLVRDIQYRSVGQVRHKSSGTESSMSTMPTPPSLSRYNRHDTTDSIDIDSSLESMMRRVGLSVPSSMGTTSTPGLRLRSNAAQAAPVLQMEDILNASVPTAPMTLFENDEDPHADNDSDSDSLDDAEINNTAYPSAAFMMASAQSSQDDSFGSSSSHSGDSLTAEDHADLGVVPIHPFAMGVEDTGSDDSFDDDETGVDQPDEATLFGVPPQQRIRAAQVGQGQGQEHVGLRMLGEDLLQDTIGIGAQIAMRGNVEESPTPAPHVTGP